MLGVFSIDHDIKFLFGCQKAFHHVEGGAINNISGIRHTCPMSCLVQKDSERTAFRKETASA